MATYGLTTYKSDGTTAVLQNSTKGGVFAQAFDWDSNSFGPNVRFIFFDPANPQFGGYNVKDFPEYAGRTIRVFQLRPGTSWWSVDYENGVPFIAFFRNSSPADYLSLRNIPVPEDLNWGSTVLFIFVI
jgi:hypothetical protein